MIINLLTDAPKHNHALMKISTYHKQRGDDVYLNFPLMPANLTYCSVLFDYNLPLYNGDYVGGPATVLRGLRGGTLVGILGASIESCRPDYSLFKTDYSLGYSFRPCFRNCSFCKVAFIEYEDTSHHSIWEFHDSKFTKIAVNVIVVVTALPRTSVPADGRREEHTVEPAILGISWRNTNWKRSSWLSPLTCEGRDHDNSQLDLHRIPYRACCRFIIPSERDERGDITS